MQNDVYSTILAEGRHSEIDFHASHVSNDGQIDAKYGGLLALTDTFVTQGCKAVIAATGEGSLVDLDHAAIHGGTLETHWGGFIQTVGGNSTFDGVTIACGSEVGSGATILAEA